MAQEQDITEVDTDTGAEGLADDSAPEVGSADTAPEGDDVGSDEGGEVAVAAEAEEWDLTDADLDALPKFRRMKGDVEEKLTLKELIEARDFLDGTKQAKDLQALHLRKSDETSKTVKEANEKVEAIQRQVQEHYAPVIEKVQRYEQRLATDPGGVAMDIIAGIIDPDGELYRNIRQALHAPKEQGGAGYNPQTYQQQHQAQQGQTYQQQFMTQQAQIQGERAMNTVLREVNLNPTPQEQAAIQRECSMLWNAGMRGDDAATVREAINRLTKMGTLKAPKPASVVAKPTLQQQIQKQMQKTKTGVRQTGTGGTPERKSKALEIASNW
jgi:hypothetical protein